MRIDDEIKTRGFANERSKAAINVLITASWLHSRISAHLKPWGLSHEQFNVLRILFGQHPNAVAQKDILHRMIDRSSNLTRILSKLSTKSFVTICRSECDRREYKIRLTSESIALLETLQTTMLQSVDTFHGLSESEAFHLNALLDKMRETP